MAMGVTKLGKKYLQRAARQRELVKSTLEKQKIQTVSKTDLTFKEYIQQVMPSFQFYAWNEIVIDRLQEVADGQLTRLLIQCPPRHGKSELAKLFAGYYLLRYQSRFVGVTSYSADLAYTFSRASRSYYREGGGTFNPASSSVQFWETESKGGCWSAGTGGSVTGKGASLAVLDDPVKGREEAESPAYITKLHDWYKSTLRTRINPEGGAIVIIQTRWSQVDAIGLVLDLEENAPAEYREGWHIVDFPALFEPYEYRPRIPSCVTVEEDFRSATGQALCPERYDTKALQQIKASIGSREFGALYQQNPLTSDSAIFKPHWWQYREMTGEDVRHTRKILSVDCAFTATETSDFVAIACLGQREDGTYDVIDILNERLDVVDTMRALLTWVNRYKPSAVLVERAANGEAVIQMLGKKVPNIIGIRPDKSKIARASGAAPMIEAGSVFMPTQAPWLDFVINQFTSFPIGKNDDCVDAVTQALNWMREREPMRQITATWGRSDHQRQVLPPHIGPDRLGAFVVK